MVLRYLLISITAVAAVTGAAVACPQFVHVPSLVLTLGGALGVTSLSYSRRQLRDVLDAITALFFEKRPSIEDQINELSRLTRLYRAHGLKGLESQERLLNDPFLKQGVGLLIDLHTRDQIRATLEKTITQVISQRETVRQILMTLGKLLPSFGLIGTLVGMVLLLGNLSGQDVQALPAALGLAVLTTLYGAVFANVVVAPLAARVHGSLSEREMQMRLILDWVLMMCRGEPTAVIANKLTTHLPALRADVRHGRDWAAARLSS